MGGNQSRSGNDLDSGSEMESARQFTSEEEGEDTLPTMDSINLEKEQLKRGVNDLTMSIDEAFRDIENDVDESAQDLESRLQSITASNQKRVKFLTENLERHAKLVNKGKEANEAVMVAVIDLVSTVNSYMTMLIRNIRKVKRLISESENKEKLWTRNRKMQNEELIYDVISDHQDVDAMLLQLIQTEAHREELESDIITVLAVWKEYYFMHKMSFDQVEDNVNKDDVVAAADSVAYGLSQLNCNKRIFD